jgi:hypothetical protein
MAYLSNSYAYELFISYCHGDAKLEAYSQRFARELEAELAAFPQLSRPGEQIRVFFDSHRQIESALDPMHPLSAELETKVRGAAFLVVLMSGKYLFSQWCEKERDWWFDEQRRKTLSSDGRVAVARIWCQPVDEAWPAGLVDGAGHQLPGFFFHDRREDAPQPFGWVPDSEAQFRTALTKMANGLCHHLEKFKERLQSERQLASEAGRLAENPVVYLHGRASQGDAWNAVREALNGEGIITVPAEPDALETDLQQIQNARRNRVQTMSASDAILLVGDNDPSALEADLLVIGRQDRQSARSWSNRTLPCALIDRFGAPIDTPARRTIAQRLQIDWLDARSGDWPARLREWLAGQARTIAGAQA